MMRPGMRPASDFWYLDEAALKEGDVVTGGALVDVGVRTLEDDETGAGELGTGAAPPPEGGDVSLGGGETSEGGEVSDGEVPDGGAVSSDVG